LIQEQMHALLDIDPVTPKVQGQHRVCEKNAGSRNLKRKAGKQTPLKTQPKAKAKTTPKQKEKQPKHVEVDVKEQARLAKIIYSGAYHKTIKQAISDGMSTDDAKDMGRQAGNTAKAKFLEGQ
jgi:hypothetical protein